ncbi:MAG: hypothetical protein HZA66_05620 [Rhodopseudomonas palustris]|uniref:Uncharacterized protein n=1 Tax=Rhodopseudomonas palustris TaxID=1076 RepID=A0A933W0G8_RHOPL|nr:hypothetical protein [Rhodopseudomonas palustris]
MKSAMIAVGVVCLILLGGALAAWSGLYSVAAIAPANLAETGLLHWVMR